MLEEQVHRSHSGEGRNAPGEVGDRKKGPLKEEEIGNQKDCPGSAGGGVPPLT